MFSKDLTWSDLWAQTQEWALSTNDYGPKSKQKANEKDLSLICLMQNPKNSSHSTNPIHVHTHVAPTQDLFTQRYSLFTEPEAKWGQDIPDQDKFFKNF